MARGAVLWVSLMLAGCVPATPEPPVQSAPDACGASALQSLTGQPEAVLATMRFAQRLRVIHPGEAVTLDYSESRLNIEINAQGRIATVHCG